VDDFIEMEVLINTLKINSWEVNLLISNKSITFSLQSKRDFPPPFNIAEDDILDVEDYESVGWMSDYDKKHHRLYPLRFTPISATTSSGLLDINPDWNIDTLSDWEYADFDYKTRGQLDRYESNHRTRLTYNFADMLVIGITPKRVPALRSKVNIMRQPFF